MRSGLDATTLARYLSGDFDLHVRLRVENGSGTLIDLFGRYHRYSLRLPDTQEPIGSLGVDFVRETTKAGPSDSLAPTIVDSGFNKLDDGVTYSPLLQLGRLVTFDVALTTVGGGRPAGGSALWYEVFRGYITNVDWPEYDSRKASITCNGLAGVLQHQKSENPYIYAAGTSLETVARQILDNNGFANVLIHFPVPTGKVLPNDYAPGLQTTVWSQLWDLAQSMGWICYYRYRGKNPAELTFFEPAREKTVPDATVDAHDFRVLGIDELEVRNVGYLAFYDGGGKHEMIGPVEDPASIAKYGGSLGIRRPFWISLDKASPIRSASEAQDMLQAALSDVADPDAVASATTHPLVFAEVGVDLYEFVSRDRLFDSNQTFAPFSVVIEETATSAPVSSVDVRGVPTAGADTWKRLYSENIDFERENSIVFKSARWENYPSGPHGQTGLRIKVWFDLGADVKTVRIRHRYHGILIPFPDPDYVIVDLDVANEPRSTWALLYPFDVSGIGDPTQPVDIEAWPIDTDGRVGTPRRFELEDYNETDEVGFRVFDGTNMRTGKYVVAGSGVAIDTTVDNEIRLNAVGSGSPVWAEGLPTYDQYYAPLSHGHALTDANITGILPLAQLPNHASRHASGGADPITPASIGAAETFHGHTILEVVGLQQALDGKAPTSHAYDSHTGTLPSTAFANNTIGLARLSHIPANTVLGRFSGTGAVGQVAMADLPVGSHATNHSSIGMDPITPGMIGAAEEGHTHSLGIADVSITGRLPYARLVQGDALSVVARASNSVGDFAAVAAGSDGHVLRRSGTTLGFGTLTSNSFANNTVGLSRIVNIPANTVLGRFSGTGPPTQVAMADLPVGNHATNHSSVGPDPITPASIGAASESWVSSNFASSSHNHDTRYYTETETDALIAGLVPTSRTISAGTGISGGGNLTANRTLSINRSVVDTWYADANHGHNLNDIQITGNLPMDRVTGLIGALDGKASLLNPTFPESIVVNSQLHGGIGAMTTAGTLDWNDASNTRSGSPRTLLLGTATNGPGGSYHHPFNFEYANRAGDGQVTQFAIPYANIAGNNPVWMRGRYQGTWSAWRAFAMESWVSANYQPRSSALDLIVPNTGTYGAVQINGSKGGYSGIYFTGGNSPRYLMVNGSLQGIHNGSSWDWYWSNGVLTAGTVPADHVSAGTLGTGEFTFTSNSSSRAATFRNTNNDRVHVGFQNDGGTVGFIGSGALYSGSNSTDFGIRSEADLVFSTGGTGVRLRIFANGIAAFSQHVRIPSGSVLYFDGGGDTYLQEVSANQLRAVVGGNERMRITSSAVEISSLHVSGNFDVAGSISAARFYDTTVASTRRIKDAVEDYRYDREALLALRPRQWRYNHNAPETMRGQYGAGFVAEEVPVTFTDAQREGVYFNRIVAQLALGWQDHDHTLRDHGISIESNRQRIERLERENAELRHRLAMAEAAWSN